MAEVDKVDERFKAILERDLSAEKCSRWRDVIIVVAIVTAIVVGIWYYVTRMKGKSGTKPKSKAVVSTDE